MTHSYPDLEEKAREHDAVKEKTGITVHRVKGHVIKKWNAVIDPRISWFVNDIIKKEKFDVIHAHSIYSPTAMVTAYVGKTLRNIPTLATNHSIWGDWWMGGVLRRPIREEFTRLDALIAVSGAVKKDMEHFSIDKPVFVIPSGVDSDRFFPDEKKRERTRTLLGYEDDDIVIVSVGRLVSRKKMHELVEMMPDLIKLKNVKLLIVGDGPEKNKLETLARSLNVRKHITFTGFVSNTCDYLNASDIFALCSVDEAFGISILEAMACELPVVVKNVNGITDILNGNNCLPHARDAEGIKKNLEFLIENENIRSKFAKNNRKHVLSNYAWDDICEKTLKVYDFIEEVARMDSDRYYNMKLAKMGRAVRRLRHLYEKDSDHNHRC